MYVLNLEPPPQKPTKTHEWLFDIRAFISQVIATGSINFDQPKVGTTQVKFIARTDIAWNSREDTGRSW